MFISCFQGYHSVLAQSLTKEQQPLAGHIIKVCLTKLLCLYQISYEKSSKDQDLMCFNDGVLLFQSEDIKSFSSDPRILAFAEHFCSSDKEQVRFVELW